jgi:SAM-dependent methyltransferase
MHEIAAAGFSAGVDAYERGRPGYPAEVVSCLVDELGIGSGRDVLDLAAGTGKLTRSLLPTGARVVAVEPVAEMRARLGALEGVEVLDGTAEAIPLPDASVDVVTVGQAFHWFDAPAACAEIARVLRPGGGVGVLWNLRDTSVPWIVEFDAVFEWERLRPFPKDEDWGAVLEQSGRFGSTRYHRFTWSQPTDAEGLVARALSTSYVATWPPDRQAAVAARVRDLVHGFPPTFDVPHVSHVWCSTRA